MAVKFYNPGLIVFGLILCAALAAIALVLRKKQPRRKGIRAANTARFRALPAYRRKRTESVIFRSVLVAGLVISIAASLLLAARPYKRDTVRDDVNRRDIFLCMDISSSSANGCSKLVKEVEELVQGLNGDQIGISLFNTSSVQYVPVTDDYDFALQRLQELEKYFEAEEEFAEGGLVAEMQGIGYLTDGHLGGGEHPGGFGEQHLVDELEHGVVGDLLYDA